MRLTKREIMLLSVFGVCLVLYLFYAYLYQPLINSTEKLVNENNQLEAVSVLADKLDAGDSNKISDEKLAAFIKLNQKVPEQPYIPETIKQIEDMSKEHNLKLVRTEYDQGKAVLPADEEVNYKECFFEIEVKGTYLNLTKLVRDLEKTDRLYDIERITMMAEATLIEDLETANQEVGYSSHDILMTVVFKSYYDEIAWPNIKGVEEIIYLNEIRTNPFAQP